jgi:hypothetical protein
MTAYRGGGGAKRTYTAPLAAQALNSVPIITNPVASNFLFIVPASYGVKRAAGSLSCDSELKLILESIHPVVLFNARFRHYHSSRGAFSGPQ